MADFGQPTAIKPGQVPGFFVPEISGNPDEAKLTQALVTMAACFQACAACVASSRCSAMTANARHA